MSKIKKNVIKPIIQVDNQPNILERLTEDDAPVLKSVGYAKCGENKNSWISYVITTKGNEVISIEVSEPDIRPVAQDNAKISFVDCFMGE